MANMVLDKGYKTTAAITQFACVVQTADDTVVQAAAASAFIIGVCQETISAADGTSNRVANIRVAGISRAINGTAGALARGTRVTSDASGRVVAATTGKFVVGVVTVAGAAQGDIVEIELTPGVVV